MKIVCFNVVIRREDVEKYGFDIIYDERVHRIHDNCFRDNEDLVDLIIPSNITKLGRFSFSNCQNLTKVVVPSSIKELPYCCFEHCSLLTEIELPEGIKSEWKSLWECNKLSKQFKRKIYSN